MMAGSIIAEMNVAVEWPWENGLKNKLELICVHHLISSQGSYGDRVPSRQTVCQEL